MATPEQRRAAHSITVEAEPDAVYRILADATLWPVIFNPTVHVARTALPDTDAGAPSERLRLWAFNSGRVRGWTSLRTLEPDAHRISFRRETSRPPVREMAGLWTISPRGAGCVVELEHTYSAVDDDPDGLAWIANSVEQNSESELASLKRAAESPGLGNPESWLTFEDRVRSSGRAADLYRFLYRADEWPALLPHVARLELREEQPGEQYMEMDTRSIDGSQHTTTSVRICFEPHAIFYKQLVTPAVMRAHTGVWTFTDGPNGGSEAVSRHTVVLDPEGVRARFGNGDLVAAAVRVRESLSANSQATLRHAIEATEESDRVV